MNLGAAAKNRSSEMMNDRAGFFLRLAKKLGNLSGCVILLSSLIVFSAVKADIFVEDSFEDFVDGTLDASGQNIYVSRDGSVRTIGKFDLNDDGWIDLLFMNTHDMKTNTPATLESVSKNREITTSQLTANGSTQVAVKDLNRDGYADLVFTPNPTGVQHPRLFLTIVYGASDGWSSQRASSLLPVNGEGHYYRGNIVMTVIADLNHDQWPDIVTLNSGAWLPGQPAGKIVRIYWGADTGYSLARYRDVGIPGTSAMVEGDFDGDDATDVAFLKSDNSIQILWAQQTKDVSADFKFTNLPATPGEITTISAADINGDGEIDLLLGANEDVVRVIPGLAERSWGATYEIPSFKASHIAVEDIDGDSYQDIVLSYFALKKSMGGEFGAADKQSSGNYSNILWGGEQGYDAARSTKLAADYLKASALGDFDGDGNVDVALAVYQDDHSFAANSLIYYGNGRRKFEKDRAEIPTAGAFCAETVAAGNDKSDLLIFCNSKAGTVGEKVPLFLYWGGPLGFSEQRRTDIPFASGNGATAADFNADGYVDLLAMNSMHAKQTISSDPTVGANIFWGGPDGIDFNADVSKRTVLREEQVSTANVADFNRDGYLDIVLGQYVLKGKEEHVMIYYGSEKGYELENAVKLYSPGWSLGDIVADYDQDGWLDIAVMAGPQNGFRIFYGSSEGFDENNVSEIELPWCVDLETADFNGDGWLDMLAGTYEDSVNKHHDIGVTLFWGGPDGFQAWNKMTLPGNTPIGSVVADFDSDGFLDMFNPLYHRDIDRENIPTYLYWGSAEGFHPENRSVFIIDSSHDGLAADFDKDGRLDLAVVSHTKHNDHNTFSKVFYNDGNRFENPRVESLPTTGPHWMYNKDMGHIYDRSWEQTYTSSIIEWSNESTQLELAHSSDVATGTELTFEFRSAAKKSNLDQEQWRPVETSGVSELSARDRFLQYRATFKSDNGDRYPILNKVTITISEGS